MIDKALVVEIWHQVFKMSAKIGIVIVQIDIIITNCQN